LSRHVLGVLANKPLQLLSMHQVGGANSKDSKLRDLSRFHAQRF
jgi:hypothetical protein